MQLQPNEAEPAFESHAVDAWAIWEPFTSIETLQRGATVLTDDAHLGSLSTGFTLVRTKFATEHPDLVVLFLQVLQSGITWENQHLDTSVRIFSNARHLDPTVVRSVLENGRESADAISPQVVKDQQHTADFLQKNGGLSQKIDVSKVVDNSYIDKATKETNLKL